MWKLVARSWMSFCSLLELRPELGERDRLKPLLCSRQMLYVES